MATEQYKLRLPGVYAKEKTDFQPPSMAWMQGQWWVTHSSLPLWNDKANVNMNYTPLPVGDDGIERIDDLTQYQARNSNKVKTINGVNTPTPDDPGAWDWRGKGWLKIASSHWELLGHGDLGDGDRWMVTYFQKTLFTPAGIDVYSRKKEGLPQAALDEIMKSLKALDHIDLQKLATDAFEIPHV